MKPLTWDGNRIQVEPPKKPKKMTGTRFGAVLGLNRWSSPFNVWCAITRTYEEPFVDSKYTIAGKVCEPKIIDYLRKAYMMDNLRTPSDIYGEDYFQKTWGDFFGDTPIFGGSWDSLLMDEDGKPEAVIEIKTSSRPEDWQDDVPEYYALQAALYAYLLGVDDVIMVASFLEPSDYDKPEKFVPSAKNTITIEFKVSERYADFGEYIAQATEWWKAHVETGISPDFDEKKDAEILAALRTHNLTPDTDINTLIKEAECLKADVDKVAAAISDKEKRLKEIGELIKEHAMSQFRDGDKKVEVKGSTYTWAIARSETTTVDKDALKSDGLLEKYSKTTPTYRMTVK